jgi:hypothetical protein
MNKYVVLVLEFSSIQKCIAAMRILAYGDPQDDYLRMVGSIAIEDIYRFCKAVVVFGPHYMRRNNSYHDRKCTKGIFRNS